jgi:SAM-dependent methyltransferase
MMRHDPTPASGRLCERTATHATRFLGPFFLSAFRLIDLFFRRSPLPGPKESGCPGGLGYPGPVRWLLTGGDPGNGIARTCDGHVTVPVVADPGGARRGVLKNAGLAADRCRMMKEVVRKVEKSLRRRGLLGTLRHSLNTAVRGVKSALPARRRARERFLAKDAEFDATYGVDTGGLIHLGGLTIEGQSWLFGGGYQGIEPNTFSAVLGDLDIPHADCLFIDYGSGKGRALLLAARWPFKKVIGIEFSRELVDIARENIRKYRGNDRRCSDIEVIHADALTFELPEMPAVLFFYNPFEAEIMKQVLARIERSLKQHPRLVVVIYLTPSCRDLWDHSDVFGLVSATKDCAIYRSR